MRYASVILGMFVTISSVISATDMTVQIPDEGILRDRCAEKGLDHLTQKTHIIDQLAGKEMTPFAVMIAVSHACRDYGDYLPFMPKEKQHVGMMALMSCKRNQLIEILLKDSGGLKALEDEGYY